MKDFKTYFESQQIPPKVYNTILNNHLALIKYIYFLVKRGDEIPKEVYDKILKHPGIALDYAIAMIKNERVHQIPKDVKQVMLDQKDFYKYANTPIYFAQTCVHHGVEIPKEFLEKIALAEGGIDDLRRFILYLIENNKEVPLILLNAVKEMAGALYDIAKRYVNRGKRVPEELISIISQNSFASYQVMLWLNSISRPVPEVIRRSGEEWEKDLI
jgi:hypothetical protein